VARAKSYRFGEPGTLPLTASADITAGTPQAVAGLCGIPPSDIASGDTDSLQTTGLFYVRKAATWTGSAGDHVYYDADGDPIVGTAGTGAATSTISAASGDLLMGTLAKAAAATDNDVLVAINQFPNEDILEDVGDISLPDNISANFGDADDLTMTWDATQFVIDALTADSAIFVGVDGAGLDLKLYGDTAGSSALWDQSADTLIFNGADLNLQDTDILQFGDALDLTMTWDGTQFVIDALTADTAIFVGVDGAGLDLKLYGDTASSYALWDQSADKFIIVGGTADLGTSCEADAYTVGGAAGIDHGPADITSITVVKGIVTAITSV